MPIYVYECYDHGDFEITLKFSDKIPKRKQCPAQIKYCNPVDHNSNRSNDTQQVAGYQ